MVESALQDEQSRYELKRDLKLLVESIADKYAVHESAKKIPRAKLIKAGWTHFDLALRNYRDRARSMTEGKNNLFYFSTYFTWYVRQGIVEYLKSENNN